MALLPVPVHPICIRNRGQCEVVHGAQRQRYRGRCPTGNPGCWASTRERLALSSAVPGLGGGCRGCSGSTCNRPTQPANPPVSVHLHNHGVFPPAGQAVHHVPAHAAHTGHPPAASLGRQVSGADG